MSNTKEKYTTCLYATYEAEVIDSGEKVYGAMFDTVNKKTQEVIHCMLHNDNNGNLTCSKVKPETVKRECKGLI